MVHIHIGELGVGGGGVKQIVCYEYKGRGNDIQ